MNFQDNFIIRSIFNYLRNNKLRTIELESKKTNICNFISENKLNRSISR